MFYVFARATFNNVQYQPTSIPSVVPAFATGHRDGGGDKGLRGLAYEAGQRWRLPHTRYSQRNGPSFL